MHLLDTDIATLVFYGKNTQVLSRFEAAIAQGPVAVTIITWVEMIRGRCDAVSKASTSEEWHEAERRLLLTRDWLAGFDLFRIGSATKQLEHFRNNKRFRFTRGLADLMTACIALANDATLVTRNTKDFTKLPGLKLENWAE